MNQKIRRVLDPRPILIGAGVFLLVLGLLSVAGVGADAAPAPASTTQRGEGETGGKLVCGSHEVGCDKTWKKNKYNAGKLGRKTSGFGGTATISTQPAKTKMMIVNRAAVKLHAKQGKPGQKPADFKPAARDWWDRINSGEICYGVGIYKTYKTENGQMCTKDFADACKKASVSQCKMTKAKWAEVISLGYCSGKLVFALAATGATYGIMTGAVLESGKCYFGIWAAKHAAGKLG